MGGKSQNLSTQLTMSSLKKNFFFLFPCGVFCIRARILEIASHGVLWGWFEPRYWNLFEYSVDCADSGGRPSDGCDEFSNGRGQSVLVR